MLADSAFQGIDKFHKNSEIPKKKTKNHLLTEAEKSNNHKISSERVQDEHAIVFIKRFRIVPEKYQNRRGHFALKLNLISSICNYEILF